MQWEDIVIIRSPCVTFLNKQVANVSAQQWSYCSDPGGTFSVKRNLPPSKLLYLQKEVWGNSPTSPTREDGLNVVCCKDET